MDGRIGGQAGHHRLHLGLAGVGWEVGVAGGDADHPAHLVTVVLLYGSTVTANSP